MLLCSPCAPLLHLQELHVLSDIISSMQHAAFIQECAYLAGSGAAACRVVVCSQAMMGVSVRAF